MSYASIVKNTDDIAPHHYHASSSNNTPAKATYESTIYTESRFYPLVPLSDIQEKQRKHLNKKMGIVPIAPTKTATKSNKTKPSPPQQPPPQPVHQEPPPQLLSPTNTNPIEICSKSPFVEVESELPSPAPPPPTYKVVDALDVKEIVKSINEMTQESPYAFVIKTQQLEIKKNIEQMENYKTFINTQSELIAKQEKTLGELRKRVNKNNLIAENGDKTIATQAIAIDSYNKQVMELSNQYNAIVATNQALQQQNAFLTQQNQEYQQHLTVIKQQLAAQYATLQQLQAQTQLPPQLPPQPQMVYYQQPQLQPQQYQPQQQPMYVTPEMSAALANAMAQMMMSAVPTHQ